MFANFDASESGVVTSKFYQEQLLRKACEFVLPSLKQTASTS